MAQASIREVSSEPIPQLAVRAESCRICGASLPEPFLDLGTQPLANAYSPVGVELPKAPLAVTRCPDCTMLQLTHTVDPTVMFVDYAYQSSVSTTWVRHCSEHIDSLLTSGALQPDATVVEVASNDGYLLRHLRSRGIRSFGVEPAVNLAEQANRQGLATINAFMGADSAPTILEQTGAADLIIANNVLAHVPDPVDFLSGIAQILAPQGRISIESPHALRLVEGMQFDTVYHEHVFYLTIDAVSATARRAGLELIALEPVPTHGGSLRMTFAHQGAAAVEPSVARCEGEERSSGLLSPEGLSAFANKVQSLKEEVLSLLTQSLAQGASWAAFGAAAKGVVFVNYLELDRRQISFVVDNNPSKQGRVMPGTDIPIVSLDHLAQASTVTDMFVFAWNIADELSREIEKVCAWPINTWAALPHLHRV